MAQEARDEYELHCPSEESESSGGDNADAAKQGDAGIAATVPLPGEKQAAQSESSAGTSGQGTLETAAPVKVAAIAEGDEATATSGGNDDDTAAGPAGAAEGSSDGKAAGLEDAGDPAAGDRQE